MKNRGFPGVEIRKVEMGAYNEDVMKGKGKVRAEEYKQLHLYTAIGKIEKEDLNLAACAHLYASDRNSLFIIRNAVPGWEEDEFASMASLSHTVVFHVDGDELRFEDEWRDRSERGDGRGGGKEAGYEAFGGRREDRKWFCQEAWTGRSGGGRGMHESRIWSPGGVLVATTLQEGVVRRVMDPSKDNSRNGSLL